MRIITVVRLEEWADQYPDVRDALERWVDVTRAASWHSIVDVRRQFPHADAVLVASGRPATVFNVRGNRYRLITAIHYNRHLVHTLRFLTHAEYTQAIWKEQL